MRHLHSTTEETQWLQPHREPKVPLEDQQLLQLEGQIIGAYLLVRFIGQGGMGAVYQARRIDNLLEQQVAFKFLFPSVAAIAGQSMQQEALLLSKIKHPHITQIYDAGQTDTGFQYIVMEYIEGLSFDRYIAEHRLDLQQKLQLFLQVCDAICASHSLQIVHGDLKPANIRVTAEGQVKLLDFGIARQLHQEQAADDRKALSLPYAAPELLEAQPSSMLSDQYALGVILYQCICGQLPYQTEGVDFATARRQKNRLAAPLWPQIKPRQQRYTVRFQLEALVLRPLNVQPEQRFPDVATLKQQLEAYLRGDAMAHQQQWYWRFYKGVSRHRLLSAFFLSLMTAATALAWQNQQITLESNNAMQTLHHLTQVFKQTDLQRHGKADITARELLDHSLQAIQQDQQLSSAIRWQLLQVFAEAYFGLGDYQTAEQLIQNLFLEQINADDIQPETLLLFCQMWEYFKNPTTPRPREFDAIGRYFSSLSPSELLTSKHAAPLLSFLEFNSNNLHLITGYAKIEPYLPQLYALFPDNQWQMSMLFSISQRWREDGLQLEAGSLSESAWIERRSEEVENLNRHITTVSNFHPNYTDLLLATIHLARFIGPHPQYTALKTSMYQRLEQTVTDRTDTFGLAHDSVTQALNDLIEASTSLDDWRLVEQNIQRFKHHLAEKSVENTAWFRPEVTLYYRQGRLPELIAVQQRLVQELTQDQEKLAAYNFYDLSEFADSLTGMEQKQALREFLPWFAKKLQATPLDPIDAEFYQQQLLGRQQWLQGNIPLDHPEIQDFLQSQNDWKHTLLTEMALLSGRDSLAQHNLTQSLQNIEFQLKRCVPSWCKLNFMITVLPLKLAAIHLEDNNVDAALPLLNLVREKALESYDSPENIWLQQAQKLREQALSLQ